MNRSTLAALIVALMLGSGITGYLIGKPGNSVDQIPPAPRTAVAAPPAAAPPAPPPAAQAPSAAPAATPARSMAPTPVTQPAAAPNEPFAYRRVAIDSSRPEAEACLAFNKPLATGDIKYADYVRISPEVKSALRVVDDRLCIGGLTYGQDYTVTDARRLPGQQRRQAQRRNEGRRGAGRPPGRRHPAGQGLHPAARHDGGPADHHHQRLQGRHRGLPGQRAGDRPFRQRSLRRELPGLRADHRVVVAARLAERHQRRPPVARHDGSAQPAQPAGGHRLPDPRDDQGLETRRLFRRGVERGQAAVAQLRR